MLSVAHNSSHTPLPTPPAHLYARMSTLAQDRQPAAHHAVCSSSRVCRPAFNYRELHLFCGMPRQELAQTTHILGEKAYHDYEGIVVDMGEQERLIADCGQANTVFLRNHGILTLGKSIGACARTFPGLETSWACKAHIL